MIKMNEPVLQNEGEFYSCWDMHEILFNAEFEDAPMTDWELNMIDKFEAWKDEVHENTCEKLKEIFQQRYIEKKKPHGTV